MTLRDLVLLLTLATSACGGKLVAEQPFGPQGDRMVLEWETTVPEGEPSLWLKYHLQTGSEYNAGRSRTDAVYTVEGVLKVTTGGNAVYDGVLRLDDGQPPTTQLSSTVTVGSSETCGSSGCTLKGRVRALELTELSAGSPLIIHASVPVQGDQISVNELSMQLRAK
jgi:hypothetical protein